MFSKLGGVTDQCPVTSVQFLIIAVKSCTKANIKVFLPCPILLNFLIFCKIFCHWLQQILSSDENLVKDTRIYQNECLGGEDKTETRCRFSMWVGSLIVCCNPNWEVMISFLEPSNIFVSLIYDLLNFTLKSPITTVKKGLVTIIASRVS